MNKQTTTIILLVAAAAVVYFIMSKPTVTTTTLPVYRPPVSPVASNPTAGDITAAGAATSSILDAINNLNSDD